MLTVYNFHNVKYSTLEFNSRMHSEDDRLFQYTVVVNYGNRD